MPEKSQSQAGLPSRPVTSVHVARAAGVSQTTVSLVMSGKAGGRISEETQRLVRATALELGYVPNTSARVLRGGSPDVIALAVPNVRNDYFSEVLLTAEMAARERSMAVMLVDTASDPGWVERLIVMNRAQMIAGAIIYAEGETATSRLSQEIGNLVFVECGLPETRRAIELDIASGMEQVVDHLYGLGHRRIGHARAEADRGTFRLRATFLRASLAARGAEFRENWQYESSFEPGGAMSSAMQFLRRTDVTAVFCDDDNIAANVYRACRALSVAIPADLSVVGFNDMDVARYLDPELTTVAIPAASVGEGAVKMLLASIKNRTSRPRTIPLTLQIRGSTARPR